jgi:hypothetical protein
LGRGSGNVTTSAVMERVRRRSGRNKHDVAAGWRPAGCQSADSDDQERGNSWHVLQYCRLEILNPYFSETIRESREEYKWSLR